MSLTSYRAAPPRVNFRVWVPSLGGPAGPGSDLLFRALGRSTIGAEGFHGRVRDGIGCWPLAIATRPCGDQRTDDSGQMTEVNEPGRSTETFLSFVYCPLVFWTDATGRITGVNDPGRSTESLLSCAYCPLFF